MNTNPAGFLISLLIAVGVYFAPTLLGLFRGKRNTLAIFFYESIFGMDPYWLGCCDDMGGHER